jgi:hypothetical protein
MAQKNPENHKMHEPPEKPTHSSPASSKPKTNGLAPQDSSISNYATEPKPSTSIANGINKSDNTSSLAPDDTANS